MKLKLTNLLLFILLALISCINNKSSDEIPVEVPSQTISEDKNRAYPSHVVQNFMNACTQSGGNQEYCSCILDKIQAKYSIEEYVKYELEMKAGQTNSDFFEFLASVQIDCSSLNDANAQVSEPITNEVCNVCGKEFSHNGYEEVDFNVWRPARDHIQTWICSEKCGLQANRNSEEVIENVYREAEKIVNPHGNPYPKSDYVMGDDGKIHETKNCPLCHGEGGLVFFNVETGKKDFEVCRACDGVGHLSY